MQKKNGEPTPQNERERERALPQKGERPVEFDQEIPRVDTRQYKGDDQEQIERLRTRLQDASGNDSTSSTPAELYGDFVAEKTPEGKIVLAPETQTHMEEAATQFRREAKFMTNTFIGEAIAAEYDIRTRNFSTQTRIAKLADGRKVFLVYSHKGSVVHRFLDGLMKWASGLRMKKVSRSRWKQTFERKSNIPVIENQDPDTVVMPYLPNVNGYDLFAQNAEIEDFGECTWAKETDLDAKLELSQRIVDEVARIHEKGQAWGELILPNIIFTKEKRPVICDPEVQFKKGVPLVEAQAQDLKDLCLSISGALARAHDQRDPQLVVQAILGRYPNKGVVEALKKMAKKKRSWLQNLTFGYEQVRCGVSNKAFYDSVLEAIRTDETVVESVE